MTTCEHTSFFGEFKVARFEDTGGFSAAITIKCTQCGELFRFLGLPSGFSFERPMVSIDGLELNVPIEPQGEPALYTSARYEMPKIPKNN